jgi:hypothetical protein
MILKIKLHKILEDNKLNTQRLPKANPLLSHMLHTRTENNTVMSYQHHNCNDLAIQQNEYFHYTTAFTFMLPCIVTDSFLNNQPDAPIIPIYSVIKLYVFLASSLPIIRSFLLYIRHW